MKAVCGSCGKTVTLVHPTKTHPEGARLRMHNNHVGVKHYGFIGRKVAPKNGSQDSAR